MGDRLLNGHVLESSSGQMTGETFTRTGWFGRSFRVVRMLVFVAFGGCVSTQHADGSRWWGYEERIGSVSVVVTLAKSERLCSDDQRRTLLLQKQEAPSAQGGIRCDLYRARSGRADLAAHLPHDWGFFVTTQNATELFVVGDKFICEFRQKLFFPPWWVKTTVCEPVVLQRQ